MANSGVKRGIGMTGPFPNIPGSAGATLLKAPSREGGIAWGMQPYVDVCAEFGVDNTGSVADNSRRLNNAMQVGQNEGFDLFIPKQPNGSPAVVLLQNPIEIGNGSTSGPSTYPGGGITGAGHSAMSTVVTASATGVGDADVVLRWKGASGLTSLIVINGPIAGVRLRHLTLDGGSTLANQPVRGILNMAGQNTEFTDISVLNCATGLHEWGGSSSYGGIADCIWTKLRGLWVQLPCTAVGQGFGNGTINNSGGNNFGMILDGASYNTCYGDYANIWIGSSTALGGSTPVRGLMLAASDSNRFRRINPNPVGPAGYKCIYFYYNSSGFVYCQANLIDGVNFGSSATGLVANAGATSNANTWNPNRITNIDTANGFPINPQLTNVLWDGPHGAVLVTNTPPSSTTAWVNQTGAPCMITYAGGTVSAVSLNTYASGGIAYPTSGGTVRVMPGDSVTFTYSVAPTTYINVSD